MNKKGNKKMHTPRQKVICNPIPIYDEKLFVLFVMKQRKEKIKS